MNSEIICVGTELLLGDVQNTNVTFISRQLMELGINVFRHSVVGDNKIRLSNLLESAANNNDLIVITGGLGPTCDDITKEVVCEFLDIDLVLDSNTLDSIKRVFENRDHDMTENNKKQGLVPKDAKVLSNSNGTAPGLIIEQKGKIFILLPGPPFEMELMFKEKVVPYLQDKSKKIFVSKNIHIFGMGESKVEEKLCHIMKGLKNPTLAPYAKEGEVLLRVTCLDESKEKANEKVDHVINQVKDIIGEEFIYGIDIGSLQNAVVQNLLQKNLKVATAESCTGGLVSKRITEIPGASKVFELGVCSYSNDIKQKVLGVNKDTLEKYGAVSPETAIEMAKGIRKISGADIGVSCTGIAGPGGATLNKPVGLVYVAIDGELGSNVKKLTLGANFSHERESIRFVSSSYALHMILEYTK